MRLLELFEFVEDLDVGLFFLLRQFILNFMLKVSNEPDFLAVVLVDTDEVDGAFAYDVLGVLLLVESILKGLNGDFLVNDHKQMVSEVFLKFLALRYSC